MDDTVSAKGRAEIRDRFFAEFAMYRDATLAPHLEASGRAVARWRIGAAVPQPAVAARMQDLLGRGRHVLAVDEGDLARLGEAARSREEAAQSRIRHTEIRVGMGDVPVPPWYAHGLDLIRLERWREAEAVLRFWCAPGREGGLPQVPERTRPHLLQSHGLCLYYLGQRAEAGETWRRGLAFAEQGGADPALVHGLRLMLGNSQWRRRLFAEAFGNYAALVRQAPHYANAYYNALCCADAARDGMMLAKWIGATEIAVLSHFSIEAVDEMLGRIGEDDDLRWARSQDIWAGFMERLREVQVSMGRQAGRG